MGSQTKLINDILFLYENILENKKISEASDVYDNLDFKNIGQGNPSKDNINTTLLSDIDNAARAAGVKVDITTAVSGHKKGTRHEYGNAVDIAKINGMPVSLSNKEDAEKLVDELIKLGYTKNSENSSTPKSVLTFGFPGHNDHVHVSNTESNSSSTTNDDESNTYDFIGNLGKKLLGSIGVNESLKKTPNKIEENIKRIKSLL